MPLQLSPVQAARRAPTASEIAALRALRHKIVEPPDADGRSALSSSPTPERHHDVHHLHAAVPP
jgi:hypothetical protein